jgi:hypothetical protein
MSSAATVLPEPPRLVLLSPDPASPSIAPMPDLSASPRQLYLDWVEAQIEEYKDSISREHLLELADHAIDQLQHSPDGQYRLTEILLRDAVDALIFRHLQLPTFRRWLKLCQTDTAPRPLSETSKPDAKPDRSA